MKTRMMLFLSPMICRKQKSGDRDKTAMGPVTTRVGSTSRVITIAFVSDADAYCSSDDGNNGIDYARHF